MRRPPLSTQILTLNAVLVCAAMLAASVAAQLDIGRAVTDRRQFLLLVAAIAAVVLVNGFVLRRRFRALERLIDTMEQADLSRPGLRAPASGQDDSDEVVRLRDAFNRMLERMEDERAASAAAIVRAQEDERARLARDLHDEVNQALTGVLLRLGATAQDAPPHLAAELAETRRVAAQAMDELRGLAHELRPTALDDHGLSATLRSQVDAFAAKSGLRATLELTGAVDGFRADEQLVVYRVVQESLSNVVRHAQASRVHVEVRRKGGRGVVRIVDDGVGLDPDRDAGHGMAGMRERALHAGGRLEVRGEPGHGTTVELLLGRTAPVPVTAAGPRRSWA